MLKCRWHEAQAIVKWTTSGLITVPLCEHCFLDWFERADKVYVACYQWSAYEGLVLYPQRLEWTNKAARARYGNTSDQVLQLRGAA
jgi:hypothetical protein